MLARWDEQRTWANFQSKGRTAALVRHPGITLDSSGQTVLELEQCGHIVRVWPGAVSRLQQSHWDNPAQLLLVTVMPMIFTSCVAVNTF